MREHDGLTRTPILIEKLGAIFQYKRSHYLNSWIDANSAVALLVDPTNATRRNTHFALCDLYRGQCIAYQSSIQAIGRRALCIAPTLWYLHDHSRSMHLRAARAQAVRT
jgi:hypothetical protein